VARFRWWRSKVVIGQFMVLTNTSRAMRSLEIDKRARGLDSRFERWNGDVRVGRAQRVVFIV
jgi:hypothetical protein